MYFSSTVTNYVIYPLFKFFYLFQKHFYFLAFDLLFLWTYLPRLENRFLEKKFATYIDRDCRDRERKWEQDLEMTFSMIRSYHFTSGKCLSVT